MDVICHGPYKILFCGGPWDGKQKELVVDDYNNLPEFMDVYCPISEGRFRYDLSVLGMFTAEYHCNNVAD